MGGGRAVRPLFIGALAAALLAAPAFASSPFERIRLKGGEWTFGEEPGDGNAPSVRYESRDESGGAEFAEVGRGRALEVVVTGTVAQPIVYGATVGSARTVRIGRAARVKADHRSRHFKVRFFAARVPRSAVRGRSPAVAAYDARGRLLGRSTATTTRLPPHAATARGTASPTR